MPYYIIVKNIRFRVRYTTLIRTHIHVKWSKISLFSHASNANILQHIYRSLVLGHFTTFSNDCSHSTTHAPSVRTV